MGCAIAFVGIISVQIASVHSARNKSNELADNELMGYGFVLVSIICNSIGFILEKRVFDKYRIHPLKFVSIQGFYGFIFITILSIGIQYVPCPWANRTQCVCLS
jgi:drug/metabolite transporter (DMT)-like permease